jgi:NhaA family Na+:H+ antiporter
MGEPSASGTVVRLQRPVDVARDHVRGGGVPDTVTVVAYADLLCPYCQRLQHVMVRLRGALGDRLVYVFRHFPNERAHPGAERIAAVTEAAADQGQFWQMHDWIYQTEGPVTEARALEHAREMGLDLGKFQADLDGEAVRARVDEDLADGRRNGVTGTPTLFVDGLRYDGAWDFYSMLEQLERPFAARLQRSARVFASLPASGGLVLLLSAALALICANTPLRGPYEALMHATFGVGPARGLVLTFAEWCSEALLTLFFLLVGLEIRREATAGALAERRAAALPVIAAFGGVLAPAALYLTLNHGETASGWAVPTATDIAFALGILAVLGERSPAGLRVFVAALAVVDDILSVLTIAIFYPRSFSLAWLGVSAGAVAALVLLNRWRVYGIWPYVAVSVFLWLTLRAAGVDPALTGIIVAMLLPTRPAPVASVLLAQAATALAALEHVEGEAKRTGRTSHAEAPIWDWASRNLSAASARLLSTADRIELGIAPWSTYVVLPLFAFSAAGVPLSLDLGSAGNARVLAGVILGLVIGKPVGVAAASWLATRARVAVAPDGVTPLQFVGAAFLCGVGDTVALLMADRAFPGMSTANVAKLGVLVGSALAGVIGAAILVAAARGGRARAETKASPET